MPHIDFLAVGDVVVDAFIRLKDAHVQSNLDTDSRELCMRWGDKIPYESVEVVAGVGNSANAAVAAARLGLNSALRAYVGNDQDGTNCIETLKKSGVITALIERQGAKTNYHYVLSFEAERTILVKHEQYQYAPPALDAGPQWVYLSSLGENSLPYHNALMEMLAKFPETKLAFQPGTFQIQFGKEVLADVYKRSDIFFCNKEEAQRILNTQESDNKKLLSAVQALGPKQVVITDERKGAYALSEHGETYFVPIYPDEKPPINRTGAGDAFSSTVVSALALGKSLEEALLWGPINSREVVQHIGAQKGLISRQRLEELLKNAPADYKVTKL